MKPIFNLKNAYILFFVTLFIWSATAYLLLAKTIETQKEFATLINISGQQRMLSQKTALIALRLHNENDLQLSSHFQELKQKFNENHNFLLENLNSEALQNLYFDKPNHIDTRSQEYISLLNEYFISRTPDSLNQILQTSFTLLPSLDLAVKTFENDSDQSIKSIQTTETRIFIATLITLFLEMFFIFLPSFRYAKKVEKQLQEEKQNAENANAAKSKFLMNMSHELRTPLNGILGLNELSQSLATNPTQLDYLKLSHRSSTALLNIINDILDFSKIDTGSMRIKNRAFSLEEVINNSGYLYFQPILDKKLKLRFDIDPTLPSKFIGDDIRIAQILNNALSNAVKFTHQGFIRISVKHAELATQNDKTGTVWVSFAIEDSGIGIEENLLQEIFKSFEQGDSSTTKEFEGIGLGLTISKGLIELMNGTLSIVNNPDHGVTFSFDLPLQKDLKAKQTPIQIDNFFKNPIHLEVPADIQATLQPTNEPLKTQRAPCVLLVDDNEINLLIAETLLTGYGMNVQCARDGEEAVAMCNAKRFDIVFMDLHMPVMDGYSATRRILQQHPELPIYALSAGINKESKPKIYDAGMLGYLTKPIDTEQIQGLLASHFLETEYGHFITE